MKKILIAGAMLFYTTTAFAAWPNAQPTAGDSTTTPHDLDNKIVALGEDVHLHAQEDINDTCTAGTEAIQSVAKDGTTTCIAVGGGTDISDLETLSGVASGATDLGTFTGSTIADASNNKEAMQALETAVESAAGGHDAVTIGTANGLSLSTQVLSLAAATSSNAGAATAAQVAAIEANTLKTSYTPATPGDIGGTTPGAGAFTAITGTSLELTGADGTHGVTIANNTSTPTLDPNTLSVDQNTLIWNDSSDTQIPIGLAGDSSNVNLWQVTNSDLETLGSGETGVFRVPTDVEWTSGEMQCDGTITSLVMTIAHSTSPDGTFTNYGTVSAEGAITVSGWADITAGTWIRASVTTASTGDASTCWLPFTLTNN